jgi:hypothetical protein
MWPAKHEMMLVTIAGCICRGLALPESGLVFLSNQRY